jgi:endonuclease YncB( thermonuclease family)
MDSVENKLKSLCDKDVAEFTLKGRTFIAKVVDVYDGDTCKTLVPLESGIVKFSCRLVGLDTPEMKPPMNKPNREKEVIAAKQCRNRLIQLATNCPIGIETVLKKDEVKSLLDKNTKLVSIQCDEFDKYGRLLVKMTEIDSSKTFNQVLIDEKLANVYDGGTKTTFSY